jgi:hypothetical protein
VFSVRYELYLRGRISKFYMLLGAFANLRKATTSKLVSLSLHKEKLGYNYMDFHEMFIFLGSIRKST